MFTVGQVLNNYKIVHSFPPGGFGQAHKVTNITDNSEAALKECFGRTQDELDRFEAENNILHTLQTHDYIIKPISRIIHEGTIKYFLMELADENLADFLNKNYKLSDSEKIDLFIKICEGIEHAHTKGVAHRDIWWNNVLMKNQQSVSVPKISDFGRSRDFNIVQLTSLPPHKWGLPDVSQPELYFRYWNKPDVHDYMVGDIYALGILLYYSLEVGPLPYSFHFISSVNRYLAIKCIDIDKVDDEKVRQQTYRDWLKTLSYTYLDGLRQLPSHDIMFVQKIDPILKKMCEPDFSKRYQSISDLLIDLRKI